MTTGGYLLLRRKWATELVLALRDESLRFNDLMRAVPGITDRVLTERLRELEDSGYVRRDVEAGPPIKVFYAITRKATPYLEPLAELARL